MSGRPPKPSPAGPAKASPPAGRGRKAPHRGQRPAPPPDAEGATGGGAERTCVACRQPGDREELIRVVLGPDGLPWLDYRAKLPGRGAWVHPNGECVRAVEAKPGLLSRAFKQPVTAARLLEPLRAAVEAAVIDGLSQAAAAGAIVYGHDVVVDALARGEVAQLLFASDTSERTLEAVRAAAGDKVPVVVGPWSREVLGARLGKGPVAVVGTTRAPACGHLRRQLRRLRSLG